MDINKIIDNSIKDIVKENTAQGSEADADIYELLNAEILTDDIQQEIYKRFHDDIENYIDNYLLTSKDPSADKGMYKCSLETWQACASDIGRYYFQKNRYLMDERKRKAQGGNPYRDELLCIGLTLYEGFCREFRKQFFIYDSCQFLGMNLDTMYKLNSLHAELLKKAHSVQESSMRTALASGRSNVTAMAILLNHDYDYTRTTQIVHTTQQIKQASDLPQLNAELCNMPKISDNEM